MGIPVVEPGGRVADDSGEMKRVLAAVRQVVGAERVDALSHESGSVKAHRENVGLYRPRDIRAAVRPKSVEQVRKILEIFDDPNVDCGLHAVSTGRNWGLGSREPAHDNAVTLDLVELDQVRGMDLEKGWAIVEPGVTQGRLADLLAGSARMLNVTASSAHTSVIGNGLDRGVGLRQQRTDDLVGLEVVLPGGEIAHVGWWPEEGRSTPVYPHGLGPSLLPLFSQSDLGVVTAAAVRLLPRPEAQRIIRLSFGRDNLVQAVDEMRRWVAQGLVGGVLKIYDLVSAEFYGGRAGEFLAHLCVEGTRRSAEAGARIVAEEAAESGLFSEVVQSNSTVSPVEDVVVQMVESAYAGDPSSNDAMLRATLGRPAEEVDEHGLGWLFFLPMVPFSGESIARAHGLLGQVHVETGARAGCTVNALSSDLIDFVVTVKFQRNASEAVRAHQALDRIYELFADAGFIPYRLDVDHADWIDRLVPDTNARALARRLKQAIDPNGAMAPGRYA